MVLTSSFSHHSIPIHLSYTTELAEVTTRTLLVSRLPLATILSCDIQADTGNICFCSVSLEWCSWHIPADTNFFRTSQNLTPLVVISLFQLVQSLFYTVQAVEPQLSISFLLFSCASLTQAWGRVTYHISVKLWSMFDPFHELTPVALTSQMGRGSQRLSAMTDPFYLQNQSLHHPGQQYRYFLFSSAKLPNTVFS